MHYHYPLSVFDQSASPARISLYCSRYDLKLGKECENNILSQNGCFLHPGLKTCKKVFAILVWKRLRKTTYFLTKNRQGF